MKAVWRARDSEDLVEAELVDSMVALPGQLFYSTQIPACMWIVARACKRRGAILFIDARQPGPMLDRTNRELTEDDIIRIADAYHAWRMGGQAAGCADALGFCNSVTRDEVREHGRIPTPGRCLGVVPQQDDGEPFGDKMKRLVAGLREQQAKRARLHAAITANLNALDF